MSGSEQPQSTPLSCPFISLGDKRKLSAGKSLACCHAVCEKQSGEQAVGLGLCALAALT